MSSLSFLGLGKAAGIPFRACFLQPVSVHKLLTQAALDSQLNNTSDKRRFIPNFSSLPRPIWTPLPRRRLRWKQAVFEVPAPRSMRQRASHRAHAHAVQWSDEEKLELEEARDLRHRVRIEKRFLHNRTAPSLHKHVLGPFDEGTDLCCTVCEAHGAGEFVKIPKGEMWRSSRLWRGAGPEGSMCKREAGPQTGARSQHNEKAQAQAVHVLVVPTDMQHCVTCTLCHEEAPEAWRRFAKFTRQCCLCNAGEDA